MRRIGLLPGTFDPVHLGHVAMARMALSQGDLDEVWLVVNPWPEHKPQATDHRHRLAMAELAVADVPGIIVLGGDEGRVRQTMAGFAELMGSYDDARFVFIVGLDVLARLNEWSEGERVLREAEFMAVGRGDLTADVVADLRERLGVLGGLLKVKVIDPGDARYISSAEIRRLLRQGERPVALDERVYEYLIREGLFGDT